MPQSKSLTDLPGRLIAILVFLAGVAMLCFVFMEAMHLFQTPVQGLNLPVPKDGTAPPAANIGAALAQYVIKIALLGLMAVAGSVIANKGVHLYFASNQWANAHGGGEKSAPNITTQKDL